MERHASTRIRGALLDEPRDSEALVLLRDGLDAAPRPLLQRAAETGSAVPSPA